MSKNQKSIAILNSDLDVAEALEEYLRSEGFSNVSSLTLNAKHCKDSAIDFINHQQPAVIIYDVPPPYSQIMTFLNLIRTTGIFDKNCVILITTNVEKLKKISGIMEGHEIIGKPFDLDLLKRVIQKKLESCG